MSEAPDKKSGAFGDKRYKARWVLPRELGGRHIGLYNPFYKKRPEKASARALWGASIPVIPVTVMGHRKENYTTSLRQQEGTG